MEHRPLTPVLVDSSANVRKTYAALACAIGGTHVSEYEAYTLVENAQDHPVCNFAAKLDLDPWSAGELARIASAKPSTVVYRLPSDEPAHADELLLRAGFKETYRLVMMGSSGRRSDSGIELVRLDAAQDRDPAAAFMCSQFFNRQPPEFRRLVQRATAHATELELWQYSPVGKIAAAMLLCNDAALGLYNLCVDPSLRGNGIGTRMVDFFLDAAFLGDKWAVLQCESRLEPWYVAQGFAKLGEIAVYKLARPPMVI